MEPMALAFSVDPKLPDPIIRVLSYVDGATFCEILLERAGFCFIIFSINDLLLSKTN